MRNEHIKVDENIPWYDRYVELEEQMGQMMEMCADLLQHNKKVYVDEDEQKMTQKKLREYEIYRNRIEKTWLGQVTLLYIRVKLAIKRRIVRKGGKRS